MGEEKEGMAFVPEEDLDLHQNFQPIIAENGVIRPKKLPEDLTVSPDTTFTRMDTVQDLVQIRAAEEKAKEEKKAAQEQQSKEEQKPQEPLPQQGKGGPNPDEGESKTKQEPEPAVQAKTIASGSFAPEVPPAQPQPPEPPQTSAQPQESAKPKQSAKAVFSKDMPTDLLPTIPFAQPVSKKRKSKKERRKLKAASNEEKKTPKTPAQQPVALLPAPAKKRRWLWVVAILCLLFLGTISGVVPVERIPFLRNIAYAMGFTKTDTARMSFLRALFTWTDKNLRGPNQQSTEIQSRLAAFERLRLKGGLAAGDEDDLGSLYSRAQREGGKTSLIDIKALNALQRQKGHKADNIRNSKMPLSVDQSDADTVALRSEDVNVRTEANKDNGEVFFGSDAFGINRNFHDGYDSVNELKKIANPHIAGVSSLDFFTDTARRMMRMNVGFADNNKKLGSTQLNWGTNLIEVGTDKPHRDLYRAWVASRMSKYTPNLMVKKALVYTAFMGADIPATASNMTGMGGVLIDTDSLKKDQEEWTAYLEFQKQCQAALGAHSGKIDEAVSTFKSIVDNARENVETLGYPTNCYDALLKQKLPPEFGDNVASVQQVCRDLDNGYRALQEACNMTVSLPPAGFCDSRADSYEDSFENFRNGCRSKYEEKKQAWELAHPQATDTYDNAPDGWEKDGKEIEEASIVGGEEKTIFAQIKNDGGRFATWIRARCTEENNDINCIPVDEAGSEDWTQIENVKQTIDGNILKI